MLTLILLRHAKSSWKNPGLPDQDRALATRGQKDAPVVGRALSANGVAPELILCSSARRTRDTLALMLPELKAEPKVVYDDALYHAPPARMLKMMQGTPAGTSSVMIVGHNPEIQALALDLIGHGPKLLRDRLMAKYPTAGLVVINFPAAGWADVGVNTGTLSLFLTPSDLRA
jgi:phosphohistidine phosphatase